MDSPIKKPKLTTEVKKQLLDNLKFEVTHRTRQLESWLSHALQNFSVQQENQVTHISKQVRQLKMREFMEKYNGSVHAALKGIQKERLKALGTLDEDGVISPMKKRKWPATDASIGETDAESSKAAKTARLNPTTPKRKPPSMGGARNTTQRTLRKTPAKPPPAGTVASTSRIPASPSPHKLKLNSFAFPARPPSPTKLSPSKFPRNTKRPPSSATFNPSIPKTPAYPNTTTGTRLPRRDEMMMSVNGSPLANPYVLGMGWFKGVDSGEQTAGDGSNTGKPNTGGGLKRQKSTINIRRDPSAAYGSGTSTGAHSRTNSQASLFTSTSTSSLPSTLSSSHSRTHSQADPFIINGDSMCTPKPPSRCGSAFVTIPTKDGDLLEFDPLLTSPGAIDALEGITDSVKKQAREEMGRLVQAAVDKWKIT